MRKLDLRSYKLVNALDPDAEPDDYDVRNTLGEVLLAADLNLNASQLLANHDLFRKLRDHPEDIILLEEIEWGRLVAAFETVTGFSKNDVELVQRVLKAPEVEVQEKVEEEVAPQGDNGVVQLPEAVTS